MSADEWTPQQVAERSAAAMWAGDRASQALGMEIVAVGPGAATLRMTVRDDMANGHDIGHGGLTFALADSAFAFACNSRNRVTVAAAAEIRFRAPTHRGDVLTATATERSRDGRDGAYDVLVTRDEVVVAEFTGRSRELRGTLFDEGAASDEGAAPGPSRPSVVVFDVNETLSDMAPMAEAFTDVGLPPHEAATWFAGLLRDGFALTAAGTNPGFAEIAGDSLRSRLRAHGLAEDGAERVLAGLAELPVHTDVVAGVRALRAAGLRLVTLSNGAASVAEALLGRAGIDGEFEALLSVADAPAWKPDRAAYHHALAACGVAPSEAVLVAVHPWDVDGAARAGLRTAWLDRRGEGYPAYFRTPDLVARDLEELAVLLTG